MDTKGLLFAALGLAVCAMALSLVAVFGTPDDEDVVDQEVDVAAMNRRFDELGERLDGLENSVARLRTKIRSPLPVLVRDGDATPTNPSKEKNAAVRSDPGEGRFLAAMDRFARYESALKAKRDRLEVLALDKTKRARDRRDAIEKLREHSLIPGELDDAIIASLFESLLDIPRGRDRAQIVKALVGVTNPVMIDPLIKIALHDPEDDAREDAVDALAPFASVVRVRLALEQAAQQDESSKVRRHAQRFLDQGK